MMTVSIDGTNAPGDDPDGNGVINLLEYFGGSENGITQSVATRVINGAEFMVLAIELSKLVDSEYLIQPEVSPDLALGSWTDASAFSQVGESSSRNFLEVTLPIESALKFLRYLIKSSG